jgi:hypothetical protein
VGASLFDSLAAGMSVKARKFAFEARNAVRQQTIDFVEHTLDPAAGANLDVRG